MSLNTPTDLKLILEVPGDITDPQLQSFLDDANMVVTEQLHGKGLSDARLKSIEKWLAAHFSLTLTERGGLSSSSVNLSKETYTDMVPRIGQNAPEGYLVTRYGKQAIALDTTGTLLAASKTLLPAQFRVLSGKGM